MVGVYVRLVQRGLRKLEDVPEMFYEGVKAALEGNTSSQEGA